MAEGTRITELNQQVETARRQASWARDQLKTVSSKWEKYERWLFGDGASASGSSGGAGGGAGAAAGAQSGRGDGDDAGDSADEVDIDELETMATQLQGALERVRKRQVSESEPCVSACAGAALGLPAYFLCFRLTRCVPESARRSAGCHRRRIRQGVLCA